MCVRGLPHYYTTKHYPSTSGWHVKSTTECHPHSASLFDGSLKQVDSWLSQVVTIVCQTPACTGVLTLSLTSRLSSSHRIMPGCRARVCRALHYEVCRWYWLGGYSGIGESHSVLVSVWRPFRMAIVHTFSQGVSADCSSTTLTTSRIVWEAYHVPSGEIHLLARETCC